MGSLQQAQGRRSVGEESPGEARGKGSEEEGVWEWEKEEMGGL